jgi:protein farnesyltransferase/geranylgeranyltransferase type-1 subunit alpha
MLPRQHRRTIVLALDDPSRELAFVARALAIDSKNYHTWAYRQWVLCHFWRRDGQRRPADEVAAAWDGEVLFVDSMLASDVRNNSAWNHRFFLFFESTAHASDAAVDAELT